MDNEVLHSGQRVRFRIGDIHLPDASEVLARISDEFEVQGLVTLLSDHGEKRSAFAVVEVKGILMPIIVPTSCLQKIEASPVIEIPEHEKIRPVASLAKNR